MEFSQPECERGISVPGAFKLDQLQPFKPILSWTFSNFFTFILGSPFPLFPRKGESWILPTWVRQRGLSAWVIQTGPFAAFWANFLFEFSNFFTFILEANSYYPIEWKTENGKMEFSQPEYESGISVPGAFKLDHLQPVEPILFCKFYNFCTPLYWGPILITPEMGRLKMGKWNSHNLGVRVGYWS